MGCNVYPREIEDILESHDSVLFAAVIGVPDETIRKWVGPLLCRCLAKPQRKRNCETFANLN